MLSAMQTRTKVLIGVVALLIAGGVAVYFLTRPPSQEEIAAQAEAEAAAAEAEAHDAGDSCAALTADALDVVRGPGIPKPNTPNRSPRSTTKWSRSNTSMIRSARTP